MSDRIGHYSVRTLVVVTATAMSIQLIDGARTGAFADDNDRGGLRAVPAVFVGTAPGCAPTPAGSNIVTSAWLPGMGLPDNLTSNVTPSTPPNRDPHRGLLLSKNGSTTDCSSAEARILGVAGLRVDAAFTLGFDYRNGGHCGAGAPRFNVEYQLPNGTDGSSFVGGCANGVQTPAPQDPAEWTRTRFAAAASVPPILPGSRIRRITLIVDEGTDTASVQDPNGVGLAVVDNIFINGALITRGSGIAPDSDTDDGRREDEDADWQSREISGGGSADLPVAADATNLSVGGAVDDGSLVMLELYNPAGLLVGTSLPAAGRVVLNVPVLLAGNYVLRVRNLGLTTVTTTVTIVKSVLR